MENKQAVAVAVGVGAVGTALAYLGYSVYNSNEDISNLAEVQNNSWASSWAELWSNSNTEEPVELYNEVDQEGTEMKNIKLDSNNNNNNKESKGLVQSALSAFWRQEYKKEGEREDEDENTTEVSDFN